MIENWIDDWDELCSLVDKRALASERQGRIFRGQACDWPLLPKAGRLDYLKNETNNTPRKYCRIEERKLLSNFKRLAATRVGLAPRGDLEWLAVGQHYGVPTRLIDWSESLFVAAYFACEHGRFMCRSESEYPAIYEIHGLPELPDTIDPFCDPRLGVVRPRHIEARIAAQQGLFTLHADPGRVFDHENLVCYRICKPYDIKLRLDVAGINRSTIYPDLDGLGVHLGWLYKRQRLPDIG